MISRDEAMLMLEKLHSERSVIVFIGSLFGMSFVCRGRVARLEELSFLVLSLDEQVNFSVSLEGDDWLFEYAEPGKFMDEDYLPAAARDATTLGILFPRRLTPAQSESGVVPKRERLFLCEMPDGADI